MKQVQTELTSSFCEALIGLHTFSGCDSVSSFYGKGKKTIYNAFKLNVESQSAFTKLGKDFIVSSNLHKQIEQFVCKLYKADTKDVNEARYAVYCSPSRVSQQNLPPTKDELKQHVSRAAYQAAIWRRSLENMPNIPCPWSHGWIIQDGTLKVQGMLQDPAPPDVLKDMYCKCGSGCSSNHCSCKKAGLKCTDVSV